MQRASGIRKGIESPQIYGENYLWEADLMFFTHPDFVKANDGNLYILAMIDSFTKMVRLVPLRTKDTKTVTAKILHVFNFDKPKYLRVDAGGEFSKFVLPTIPRDKLGLLPKVVFPRLRIRQDEYLGK